uniref:Uncharacterized protein n=1 Tax=Myoviridae sp. ctLq07 TaxID=2827681 RepID=A0A8S5TCK6_9CAUD|nr:MAG TPA: hypothetical protein [Myoviridae sp. ctLq07]
MLLFSQKSNHSSRLLLLFFLYLFLLSQLYRFPIFLFHFYRVVRVNCPIVSGITSYLVPSMLSQSDISYI